MNPITLTRTLLKWRAIPKPWFIAALLVGQTLTSGALAQVGRSADTDTGYIYEFKDDLLNSDIEAAFGVPLILRLGAARVRLIRPRAHFVPEMLKSVEHI